MPLELLSPVTFKVFFGLLIKHLLPHPQESRGTSQDQPLSSEDMRQEPSNLLERYKKAAASDRY